MYLQGVKMCTGIYVCREINISLKILADLGAERVGLADGKHFDSALGIARDMAN